MLAQAQNSDIELQNTSIRAGPAQGSRNAPSSSRWRPSTSTRSSCQPKHVPKLRDTVSLYPPLSPQRSLPISRSLPPPPHPPPLKSLTDPSARVL